MANTPICPPSAPAGISAKSTSQIRANLTWSPGDMGLCPVDGLWVACKPVNGYHVERRQGTGTWSEIVHLPSKSLSFSDDGLVCNTTYSYRIRAQNSSGFSDYSSEVGVTSQACAKPPKPGWMRLTKLGFRGQLLTWQEVDGETSYVMQRSSDGKRWRDWVTLPRDTNSLLVNPNMLRPPKYYYRVRAVNAYGASAHTPIVSNFSLK
jgi:titin